MGDCGGVSRKIRRFASEHWGGGRGVRVDIDRVARLGVAQRPAFTPIAAPCHVHAVALGANCEREG